MSGLGHDILARVQDVDVFPRPRSPADGPMRTFPETQSGNILEAKRDLRDLVAQIGLGGSQKERLASGHAAG